MANKIYEETNIQNIATQIRAKNGTATTYKVSEMATAISNLQCLSEATATGTSIELGATSNLTAKELDLDGRSTQYTTTGKNKLDIASSYNQTGTALLTIPTIPAGTYTISCSANDSPSNNSSRWQFQDSNGNEVGLVYLDTDHLSRSITLSANATKVNIYSRGTWSASQGVTLNVTNLMLSTSGGTYEPYTGGIASPNPDYPQDIEVIKTSNLFDKNAITSGKLVSRDNGNLQTNALYGASDYIEVRPNTAYTFTGFNVWYTVCYDVNKNYIGYMGNANTMTTLANTKYIRASILLTNIDIGQIEKGSTPSPYLPYGSIGVNVVGKNLWNEQWENGYYNRNTGAKGSGNNYIRCVDYIPIEPNINIYFNKPNDFVNYAVLFYDNSKTLISSATTYTTSRAYTTPATARYFTFYGDTGVSGATYQNNIIITKGSTASSYEPYKSQLVAIDLDGNELCSIGNVKDELVITNEGTKIIKRIGKVVLDGSENWAYNSDKLAFYSSLSDTKRQSIEANNYQISNNFTNYGITLWRDTTGTIEYGMLLNNQYLYLRNIHYSDANDFKTWLSTHNTTVYYELETPYEVDLSCVPTPHTYQSKTYVNNTEDTNMELDYYIVR